LGSEQGAYDRAALNRFAVGAGFASSLRAADVGLADSSKIVGFIFSNRDKTDRPVVSDTTDGPVLLRL
jgi:hypothetical protein